MSEPVYPIRSPIRYERADADEKVCRVSTPDGTSSLVELIEYDGPRVDWCAELEIPYADEGDKLEAMAQARGFGPHGFDCVLIDSGPTRFRGAWRNRPREIACRDGGHFSLTLSHTGVVIGSVGNIRLGTPGEVDGVEGDFLMAQARLYDSELAERAWFGILSGIFPAVCAVVARRPTDAVGTGELVEVALADVGGCPNARITKKWAQAGDQILEITSNRVNLADLPADVQRAWEEARAKADRS